MDNVVRQHQASASSMCSRCQAFRADVHKIFDTNVKGVIAMTKAVVPHMEEQNFGHVINISRFASQVYTDGSDATADMSPGDVSSHVNSCPLLFAGHVHELRDMCVLCNSDVHAL